MIHSAVPSPSYFRRSKFIPSVRRPSCQRLWLLFGVTFVFFGFSPFRFSFGGAAAPVNLAPPVVVLLAILTFGIASEATVRRPLSRTVTTPALLLFAFVAYHYLSALTATNLTLAFRDASKLLVSVILMCGIARYFPTDGRLLARVWTAVIWASTIIFAVLIYRYSVVFGASSLGANFTEETREMRNQMTWYLVFVFPLAVTYALLGGRVLFHRVVPMVILTIAMVYASSRLTWVSVFIGALSVVPLVLRVVRRKFLFVGAAAAVFFGVATFVGWGLLTDEVTPEAGRRFQYLYAPSSVQELNSYEVRLNVVRRGLSNFLEAPAFGVGLTNSGEDHNDYIRLLGEFGFAGSMICVLVIAAGFFRIWPLRCTGQNKILWVSVGTRMALVGLLASLFGINGYDSPLAWSFLGLAFVLRRIEAGTTSPSRGARLSRGRVRSLQPAPRTP